MSTRNFVENITAIFDRDDIDVPVRIFKVPNSVSASKPEAYVPQAIGIGPVHHLRPELQDMQMCKVLEAKRVHEGFRGVDFQNLFDLLKQIAVPSARASYNVYLSEDDDVLASILAVDGLFLFGLLCSQGIGREALSGSVFLRHLVDDSAGTKLARETLLGEAMMIENQIPIFILKVILIVECSSIAAGTEIVSNLFPLILIGFCQKISPLKNVVLSKNYPHYKALKHSHVLDLLYHLITLKDSPERNLEEEEKELQSIRELYEKVKSAAQVPITPHRFLKSAAPLHLGSGEVFNQMIDISMDLAPTQIKKAIELIQGLLKLPWSQLRSAIYSSELVEEEISIPRASELGKAGVSFFLADHVTSIRFDPETASFHLPWVKVNACSEVLMRNLAAYETMIKSEKEPMVLNGYVELMNVLVKTSEDVKLLKDSGIIVKSESISDDEVAKMFGGMRKSTELTNTRDFDKAIEGAIRYYDNQWTVRACRFVNKWKRKTWKFCKVFAVVLLLLLMGIQTLCSVYECPRFSFKTNASLSQQGFELVPSLRSYM